MQTTTVSQYKVSGEKGESPGTYHTHCLTIEAAGLTKLTHPPYSPDLAPSDLWMFRFPKKHLAGKMFENKAELKQAVEHLFNDCSQDYFENAFSDLVVCGKK